MMEGENIKQCRKCSNIYPKTDAYFYKQKVKSKRRGIFYRLIAECINCSSNRAKEYYREDLTKSKKVRKNYYENNKEKHLQTVKEYHTANKKEVRQKQKEWRRNNPEKNRKYNIQWQANKKHEIAPREWDDCRQYFNFRCAYCGKTWEQNKKETKKDLHKEHVIDDGRNDLKNCVPSCQSCNSSKREQSLNAWYNSNNQNYTYERYCKIYKWIRFDCLKYIKSKSKYK